MGSDVHGCTPWPRHARRMNLPRDTPRRRLHPESPRDDGQRVAGARRYFQLRSSFHPYPITSYTSFAMVPGFLSANSLATWTLLVLFIGACLGSAEVRAWLHLQP